MKLSKKRFITNQDTISVSHGSLKNKNMNISNRSKTSRVYEPRKETGSVYNLGKTSMVKASTNLNGHSKNNGQDLQRIL